MVAYQKQKSIFLAKHFWLLLLKKFDYCLLIEGIRYATSNNQRLGSVGTMIKGPNAFAPTLCFAKFHMIYGQNTHDT